MLIQPVDHIILTENKRQRECADKRIQTNGSQFTRRNENEERRMLLQWKESLTTREVNIMKAERQKRLGKLKRPKNCKQKLNDVILLTLLLYVLQLSDLCPPFP